ncbi:MAG: protein O-mannosyl-transferase family [Balneolaceae bacterium]
MNLSSVFDTHRTRNIFFAIVVFAISLFIYASTMTPTTDFWDPAERIAAAYGLQIMHPPGAPFSSLTGRIFSMFVPPEYVAMSINFISVLASSFTIMFLYLIIVLLIKEWRGPVEQMDYIDKVGLYGGAIFGALTFTVSETMWFNAVEAEVYASSMFFTAAVVWMALRWAENHDKPYSERWLVLIAYMFGIALGVHLLNLLALFFVALIVYFKKKDFTFASFAALVGISVFIFLFIYPFTVISIPSLADGINRMTYGLIGPLTYMILIVLIVAFAVYYTHKKKLRLANIAAVCYAMIIIGYSSYALIFIRSQANPPIDENNPENIEAFVSYLNREQYGQTPLIMGSTFDPQTGNIDRSSETLFPRRHSSQPHHLEYYSRFNSDWEFFWKYQVYHMYVRYFNWNFIGREADIQDTGWNSGFGDSRYSDNPAHTGFFYLPFLFGLLGMLYHFKHDWKRALSVLALFVFTGLAIIVYLNQTPHEPRERDYAYVGSFFAFSIWVGIGGTALLDLIKEKINKRFAAYGTLGIMLLAVPFWMGSQNWFHHDRSERYVARDYAYNLLNSVEENAILFTNGDNDTFPLWYLQEVEGVRTDVRVVVLSLLNTDWYIKQLRDRQTHESLPLPIELTDEEIEEMTSGLSLFNPQEIVIPVNKQLLRQAFSDNTEISEISGINRTETLEYQLRSAVPYSIPVDSLDDEVRWYLEGRFAGTDAQGNRRHYLQVQDQMVLEILRVNQWLRPVYFANTVSRDGQIGLQNFFQFEGKAYRVVPKKRNVGQFGYIDPEVHADRLKRFRFTNWNNPNVYFDENIRRMLGNYRYGFTQLTDVHIKNGEPEKAAYWLKFGEDNVPFRYEESDWTIPVLYAYRYSRVDEYDRALKLAAFIRDKMIDEIKYIMADLDEIQSEISDLDSKARQARASAKLDRQQRLRREIQRKTQRRESLLSDASFGVSRLTILQNIYYQTDNIEEAESLALEVNLLTEGLLNLPDSQEASNAQIERFGLGI